MAILASELKVYKAAADNDTSSNGGRISSVESPDNTKGNDLPDVTEAERTAGITRHRKRFFKVANDDDLKLQNSKLFVAKQSPGDDRVLLFPSAQRDTQADIAGSEQLYGCGDLDADVNAGATSLDVQTEAGADVIFAAGMTISIGDGANQEYATIAGGGVSYNGDVATLTLTAGIANAYLAATPTKVASVIDVGDIEGAHDNKSVSSASGTYDDTTYPPLVDHIGGVEETWTFTFTSATAFDVVGDTVGSVGSGNISTNFTPNNPDFSKPYFTLDFNGWGGTWANGDTLVFQTHPAAAPYWMKHIVPAGAASLAGNHVDVTLDGESA